MSTVLITGGHKGVGLQASRTIAAAGGHDLVLCGRDLPVMEQVAAELVRDYGANVRTLPMDVSSLTSVRDAAAGCKQLLARQDVAPLSALLLNAGAQFRGRARYNADGYEMTFATNCLGHFLLLHLLVDELTDQGRIIFTASGTHDPETTDGKIVGKAGEPDAIALANQGRTGTLLAFGRRYTTSKLCTILYAYELDRRLRATGSSVSSLAFDPGMIPETELTASLPKFVRALLQSRAMKRVLRAAGVTIGSLTFSGGMLARLAVDPAYDHVSGKFMQSRNGRAIEARSSAASYDRQAARKLWTDSLALVKLDAADSGIDRVEADGRS